MIRFGFGSLARQSVRRIALTVSAGMFLGGFASAQVVKAPRYQGAGTVEAPAPQLNLPPLPAAITPHGTVVEDVVVRVNDQIISRTDMERAAQQMQQDAAQNRVSGADFALLQRNMLRDMIDKQLLLSRAKELGLNADSDVIRQLNDIRVQNHMNSMDDLEKAAKAQGVSFEDFKAQIRNDILTRQVVRDEVGRRLQLSQADEKAYYEEHKAEFNQPEQVKLSEILVPLPETATPAQIAQAEARANELKSEVMKGGDFAAIARKSSGGPSAAQGGELGQFKRGTLAKVLEDQTFSLAVGESTQPIRTRQGFVILKVTGHDQAGPASLQTVEPQIQEAVYMAQMQPALRTYLTKLREGAYIDIQPGFVDSGASGRESKPVFSAYAPPPVKKKVVKQTVRYDRSTGRYQTAKTKTVIASPDATGGRTLTGAEAKPEVDSNTGMAVLTAPAKPSAPGKAPKLAKREKIRFGQAPRNALAGTGEETATAETPSAPAAPTLGSATTPGSANSVNLDDNPLTPRAPDQKKTRYAARAEEVKQRKAQVVTAKQVEKATAKPVAMTSDEKTAAAVQAAPMGVAGDTSKKPKKAAKVKGAPKSRLEDKKPTVKSAPTPVDQTASPSLAPTADTPPSTRPNQSPSVPNSSVPRPASNIPNDTTLPPVTQPVPGQQTGNPIPPPGK